MTTIVYRDNVIAGNAKSACPIHATNFNFMGDKISALGAAGNRILVDQASVILRNGSFSTADKATRELEVILGFGDVTGSLILVGDTFCFAIELSGTEVRIEQYNRSDVIVVGNDAPTALNVIAYMDCTAVEAVYCAAIANGDNDGCEVFYLDTSIDEGVMLDLLGPTQRFWLKIRTRMFRLHKN